MRAHAHARMRAIRNTTHNHAPTNNVQTQVFPTPHPTPQVEATKFTEVGFHGRDVDSIVRDLVDAAAALVRTKLKQRAAKKVRRARGRAAALGAARERAPRRARRAQMTDRQRRAASD